MQLKLQFFWLWILIWMSKVCQAKTEPELQNYVQYPALYAAKFNMY